ncbi:MAG: low molecular weight protein-tyrosine-phosphatase [Pseudomonadota bacterium]
MSASVLFVCLGNICRSPTAHGIARARFGEAFADIDSAGTGDWHAGDPPDRRAVEACARRQIDISDLRARVVEAADFTTFTHIVAMDRSNLSTLEARCPEGATAQLSCLLDWVENSPTRDIPDPYYDGKFNDAFVRTQRGVEALVAGLER